jgi:pimeloyl-ACP methyl ester carboxylesterase
VTKSIALLVLAAVGGGLMLKALVGALEPKLVFFPLKGQDETPGSLGIPYQTVRLRTSDGERLVAWQLEPERPVADVVYFHGNGGNLSVWLPVLATLHRMHLRVLAVDYRGYGLSSGSPSEAGLYRDAEAAVVEVRRQRIDGPRRPVVFWGRSLGGPVAAAAARIEPPDGLILESTFADKAAVVRSNPVLRALNLFARYRFPTVELLETFREPVLVMHARRDSVIPFALGRELYERLSPPKQFVEMDIGDHNDLFDISRQDYWKPILAFISGLPARQRPGI